MADTRKIGVVYPAMTEERKAKINNAAAGFEVVYTKADDVAKLADCEIIFGNVTKEVIQAAKNLKWLHTQTAGVDLYARPDTGLMSSTLLTNSSGAFGIGIAEHLMVLSLMLLRKMGEYGKLQAQSKWQDLGRVETLYNKNITIVGIGDIGGKFAEYCHALGALVTGVSRNPRKEKPSWAKELYTIENINSAIENADIVALCLPGTTETASLFDETRLKVMKKGALLINIGRGSAIDQDALINMLNSGHIGGFGTDVTNPEPLPSDSPLWQMPNVIITPHTAGGNSLTLIEDLIVDKFARYLVDYTNGRTFTHLVDPKVGY
ncbi:MAG: D-2-hydroxyacid dehydrogenase [Defluviitaleaceae bacterium]|nr:D-2-hydroxyacid dehydrogenase [Defluviitaleaceae bacterium]